MFFKVEVFSCCSDLESSKSPPGFVEQDEKEQQFGNLMTPVKITQTINPVFQSFFLPLFGTGVGRK